MTMNSIWIVFVFSLVMSGVHCEKRGKEPDYETVVCEGKSLKISCEGHQQIHISEAEYGRTEPGSKYCPFFLADWNTNCHSKVTSLGITREECEGFTSCTLYANNDEYGGDPCFGTHKYLKVSYKCVPAKPNTLEKIRVCENQQAYLDCPKGRKIDVEYANYGRLKGRHVCGFFIFTTDCKAENSLRIVDTDCQGKSRCLLQANNGKFGDPCWGTQKYLEVHYRCRK